MRRFALLPLLVLIVGLSACASTAHLNDVHHAVARANPDVRLRRTAHVSVGPLTVGLARMLLRATDDAETREAAALLRRVRTARVWIYDVDRRGSDAPLRLASMPPRRGWSTLLRVSDREDDGAVLIQTRERRGHVTGMLLTILDDDGLVLIDLGGALDRLVDEAMVRYAGEETDAAAGVTQR